MADITRRAGVSRSSFFNYFDSKADVVWSGLDERITAFEAALGEGSDAASAVRVLADGFVPDALALALTHAGTMQLAGELDREAAVRQARIARAVSGHLVAGGVDALTADVRGGATGAAVLAAVRAWARQGAGRAPLGDVLTRAMRVLG